MRAALAALLVASAAFLLFWRLDNVKLFRDEATTANWGRLMAENGTWLPWTTDGDQLVVQAADGHDVNSKLLPAMHSYLQFYVAAASFKLLGTNAFTARLPFVLCGAAALWVLYRLGVLLFGPGLRPFLLPFLGLLSIDFLNAARVCRYYALVYLIAAWLLLEFCRYLKNPTLADERGFYLRLAVAGVLLYEANYVSFAGMWGALGLFVLLVGDRRLLRGFFTLSAGLGIVLSVEFWMLHSDFAANWPRESNRTIAEIYERALFSRGRDFWRTVPLLLLLPAAFYAAWRSGPILSRPLKAAMGLSLLVAASPFLVPYTRRELSDLPPVFWALAALWVVVPGTLFVLWRRSRRGVFAQAALLGGLVLLVSPLFTTALGKDETRQRHYYQIIPAAVLLGGLATSALSSAGRRVPAAVLLGGLLIWPNLNLPVRGGRVVSRQLRNDDSMNGPLIDFLRNNVRPGEKVAFYRNVKGMAIFFHLPDLNWVALLDSEAPHNRQFRGRLPDHQFDDYPDVDWYVIWSARGKRPRGLTPEHQLVWEHSYLRRKNWWNRDRPDRFEKYEVYYRGRPAASDGADVEGAE